MATAHHRADPCSEGPTASLLAQRLRTTQATTTQVRYGAAVFCRFAIEFLPLRCPDIVPVLSIMESGVPVEAALIDVGVPRPEWTHYARTLRAMIDMGMLVSS